MCPDLVQRRGRQDLLCFEVGSHILDLHIGKPHRSLLPNHFGALLQANFKPGRAWAVDQLFFYCHFPLLKTFGQLYWNPMVKTFRCCSQPVSFVGVLTHLCWTAAGVPSDFVINQAGPFNLLKRRSNWDWRAIVAITVLARRSQLWVIWVFLTMGGCSKNSSRYVWIFFQASFILSNTLPLIIERLVVM